MRLKDRAESDETGGSGYYVCFHYGFMSVAIRYETLWSNSAPVIDVGVDSRGIGKVWLPIKEIEKCIKELACE